MRILFMGPPGAGKGTQAAKLAERLRVPHIATGDLMRRERDLGTPLGLRMKEIMERGDLVPDELTNEMLLTRLRLADTREGFVLDGYPRTLAQAEVLDRALETVGAKLDVVVKFMVTGDEIVQRLSGRRVCPNCKANYHVINHPPAKQGICDNCGSGLVQRADDDEAAIRRRLEAYGEQTKPVYEFYDLRSLLKEVDGIGPPQEVFTRLLAAIGR